MGLDTRLRNRVKKEYDSGASIYTILHPNTLEVDPNGIRPSTGLLREQILSNNFSNVKSVKGFNSTLNNKIDYDLAHAKRVYLAFSVDLDSETKTAQLQAALESHNTSTENRDDTELEQDIIKDTVLALKRADASALDIQASFVRSSILKGVITLESLAICLKISFSLEVLDLALATLIKAEIDLI